MPSRCAISATALFGRPHGLRGFLVYLRGMSFAALRSGPRLFMAETMTVCTEDDALADFFYERCRSVSSPTDVEFLVPGYMMEIHTDGIKTPATISTRYRLCLPCNCSISFFSASMTRRLHELPIIRLPVTLLPVSSFFYVIHRGKCAELTYSAARYHPRRSSTPEWGVVEIKRW